MPYVPGQSRHFSPRFHPHKSPKSHYTKAAETGDPFNWFMPNKRAFQDFVLSSGFTIINYSDDGGWASIAATKGSRPFTLGVEGWNEAAAKGS
jgi:hypothetical protein